MTNWSALSSLSVWAQASRSSSSPGILAAVNLPGGVVTFLLGSRPVEASTSTVEVVHVCVQSGGKDFLQRKLQIDVKFTTEPRAKEAGGKATPEAFQQILVAFGGRALALFSPSCCAIVSLPDFFSGAAPERCEALVVSPRQGQQLLKVAWHPMSDAHLGVLSSDGSWSLLNLALSLDEPEVHFTAPMGLHAEAFVDFVFLAPGEDGRVETPEDLWLSLSVFFLTASGRISFRNPVLPSTAVLSRRSYEALNAALALAAQGDRFAAHVAQALEVSVAEANVVLVKHRHHLHGSAQPFSVTSTGLLEQLITVEDEPGTPSASSSGKFCQVQVCCSSPLVILARATTSGLVELLALESSVGPWDGPRTAAHGHTARVLEEIDLMCNKSTQNDFVRLGSLGDRPGLLVHTRSLLASVEVSPSASGAAASVTTLAETRSNDVEFASWSLVEPGMGLLLRLERGAGAKPRSQAGGSAPSKSVLMHIEIPKKASTSTEKAATYGGHSSKLSPSSLHLLEQPLVSSKSTAVPMKPADLAKRVATLRSGIASIQCRQELLKHLAQKSFPARAEVLQQELQLDTGELRARASAGAQRAQQLQLRQTELAQRQAALVKALSAAAEARQLEDLNDAALPKLYAQLYELRRAAELLHSSKQALATADAPEPGAQRPISRVWKPKQKMLAQN